MEDTGSLDAVVAQAKAAIKSGHASQACALLQEHKEQGWEDGLFLSVLGAACCLAGKPADGVAAFERLLDVAPSEEAHFNLGQAYQMAGDIDSARTCYAHALSLDPSYGHAIHALEALRNYDKAQHEHDSGAVPQQ